MKSKASATSLSLIDERLGRPMGMTGGIVFIVLTVFSSVCLSDTPFTLAPSQVPATASSENSSSHVAANTINRSGMWVDGGVDVHTNDHNHMWLSASDTVNPHSIQWEFDDTYQLWTMNIWNPKRL